MNTEEAIEFVDNIPCNGVLFDLAPLEKRKKQVIILLQRGEKFEKMWGEFKKKYGRFCFNEFSDKPKLAVWVMMDGFKQKYFPVEVKE